jgi:cellobiose transport system permease protein
MVHQLTGPPPAAAPAPPPGARGGRPPRSAWRRRLSRWDTKGSPYAFIAPFFVIFAIFGAFPMLYTFWVSLHRWELIGDHTWTGLDNYRTLLTDPTFWNAALNTFGIFVLATVPQFVLALFLADALSRRLRMRTLFRMGVLIPNVTSVAAVALIFGVIFAREFGLANWALGWFGIEPVDWVNGRWASWFAIATMVDWRWTGYNALIFLAAMQAIPRDLYEAAEIDGAGRFRQFTSVTLPMLRPTLMFTSIVSVIGGVQLFTEPLLLNPGAGGIMGGSLRQSQTLMMYMVEIGFNRFEFGYAAAVSWLVFLMILVVAVVNVLLIRRISSAD